MIDETLGFIRATPVSGEYRLGKQRPKEPCLDARFFVDTAVKSIGRRQQSADTAVSSEFAVLRGSFGNIEVKP